MAGHLAGLGKPVDRFECLKQRHNEDNLAEVLGLATNILNIFQVRKTSKILLDFFPVAFSGTLFVSLWAAVPDSGSVFSTLSLAISAQVRIKN
jgi:hypothetical protein